MSNYIKKFENFKLNYSHLNDDIKDMLLDIKDELNNWNIEVYFYNEETKYPKSSIENNEITEDNKGEYVYISIFINKEIENDNEEDLNNFFDYDDDVNIFKNNSDYIYKFNKIESLTISNIVNYIELNTDLKGNVFIFEDKDYYTDAREIDKKDDPNQYLFRHDSMLSIEFYK